MTYQEAIAVLKRAIDTAGGQRAFAQQVGFSPAYVNDVVHGRRMLSDKMLAVIGLRQDVLHIVTYRER